MRGNPTMNIFSPFIVFTFVQIARSEVYTNENGVKFEYAIDFKSRCRSQVGRFSSLHGLSIAQCVEECGLRRHCAALNYRRRTHVCELFSVAEEGDDRVAGCIFISASNINVLKSPCDVCELGKVCDTKSQACIYKECQIPSAPENGKILGNNYKIGGKIKYKCNNVETHETVNAVCLTSGQWSMAANCTKHCSSYLSIENGHILQDHLNSTIATVSCDYGYQPNLATINCIGSGEWENATCDPKDCGSLSSIADGTVSVPVTTHGATATYTCNFDYALTEGDSTRSCDTGTWTGIEPTCTPIPNRGCYVVGYAYLYQGTRQTTSDGIICQRWDSQSPHGHNRNDPAAFPDISVSAAANYCRDPDGTGAPWCYTVDSNIRWNYCGVKQC